MRILHQRGWPAGCLGPGAGQAVLDVAVGGQVSGAIFLVSQNDVNLGNGPATITCTIKVEALGYVKKFVIGAEFVNTLQ